MPDIIEVGEDLSKVPGTPCPYCKKEMHLMVDAFKPDVSKIVRSNCPFCNGEIYAGLIIIASKGLRPLTHKIQRIIELFDPSRTSLIDNPDKGRIIH